MASWICACRSCAARSLDSGASDVDGSAGSPGEKVRERLLEALDEGLVEVLGDDQPLGGRAGLAGVLHPAHGRGLDGGAQVVGVEHDERVAAAELEHRLLQVLAGQRADGAARALAAGQGHALDPAGRR